ncbi:MAG TPA: terminase [Lactobacillus sp.]|nr:terminase [Lactobacillus sp.]
MKKWEEAEKDYLAGMKYKDIATKYDVSVNTVKSWRSRHGWARGAPAKKSVHPKSKKVAPKIVDELEANGELNDNQKLFCLYYLQRFNATWAYQKAYEVEYSVANVNGSRMLVNASIQKQLSILKKQQASDLYFDVADVIKKYIQQANSDVTDVVNFRTVKKLQWYKVRSDTGKYEDSGGYFDWVPKIDPETGEQAYYYENIVEMKDSNDIDTSNVKSVKIDKGEAVVEMYDKQKALDSLMKYADAYTSQQEDTNGVQILDDIEGDDEDGTTSKTQE